MLVVEPTAGVTRVIDRCSRRTAVPSPDALDVGMNGVLAGS
jgi:hypothetical protein